MSKRKRIYTPKSVMETFVWKQCFNITHGFELPNGQFVLGVSDKYPVRSVYCGICSGCLNLILNK